MSARSLILGLAAAAVACTPAASDPPSGQGFPERRMQARAALRSERWEDAARLYESLVAESPHDGVLWQALGLSRLRAGDHDAAVRAYREAIRTGFSPPARYYDIACAEALAGRPGRALDALEQAYAAGFANDHLVRSDSDLASLHDVPRFREIVGWPDPAVRDRTERPGRDLDYLARRIREVHWRPFAETTPAELDAKLAAVREAIDASTDLELRLRIQEAMASIGDGHTAVVADFFRLHHGGAADVHFLPVELFLYEDGVRVVAATREHAELVGARALRIGRADVDSLCGRLDRCVSRDNEWGARWGLMQALADPGTLEALDLGSSSDGFDLEVERPDGSRVTVSLPVGGPEMLDRVRLHDVEGREAPLRYREKRQHLWMQPLDSALYVRIDGVRDGHDESFHAFTERIFTTAEDVGARALILDVRDNLGGQGHLLDPLLRRLSCSDKFGRAGGLYVLVGRKTFSAAMALVARLETSTEARFVGEPTGSRPNFVGESSIVFLPYSGMAVSISSRYHQNGRTNDRRRWIPPDLPAPPRFAAEREGRDPALEAVRADLAR